MAPGAGRGKLTPGGGNGKSVRSAENSKTARSSEFGKPAQGALRGKWDQGAESVRDNTAAPASSPRPMKKPRPVLLAVNKPKGVVCTASDKDKAPNIVDMIQYPVRVYYVGRLDKDSEGLVLMTNQGDLVNKIMRSGNAHEKEYQVVVDRPVTAEFLARMEKGVRLKELDRTTLPCKVRKTGDKRFSIVLTQGLNRQIRRMCEACGCHVRSLKRVRVMNICLGDLKSGEYRQVEGAEYREFMKLLEHSTSLSFRQQNAARGRDQSDGE
ncbi:pseudouridine synthase [Enterocloster lavalensis]|uniref:pseudouridine synthase n=1 Tax=Enterocloster lavalensis TaxID=460384 RepID=UPI0034A432F2